MTAVTAVPTARALARPARDLLTLGAFEAVRLLRHPLHLAGWLSSTGMLIAARNDGPHYVYSALVIAVVSYHGVLTFFAANLCASRERRAGAAEWGAALPMPAHVRTGALCLAALAPAALAVLTALAARVAYAGAPHLVELPDTGRVVSGAVAVLGAGTLGVMVARWAPWPGAAAVVMVGVVAATIWLYEAAPLFAPYVEWANWSSGPDPGAWAGTLAGSGWWHAAYVVALAGLAAAGALLVHRGARSRALLLGGLAGLTAVVTGWAQLP